MLFASSSKQAASHTRAHHHHPKPPGTPHGLPLGMALPGRISLKLLLGNELKPQVSILEVVYHAWKYFQVALQSGLLELTILFLPTNQELLWHHEP